MSQTLTPIQNISGACGTISLRGGDGQGRHWMFSCMLRLNNSRGMRVLAYSMSYKFVGSFCFWTPACASGGGNLALLCKGGDVGGNSEMAREAYKRELQIMIPGSDDKDDRTECKDRESHGK